MKPKILIIQGSPRSVTSCANQDSKSHQFVQSLEKTFSLQASFDVLDLSLENNKPIVAPCKGCYSTSKFHCHFPCDCYTIQDPYLPDLLTEKDFYWRIQDADAFLVVSPINWYAVTAQIKTLFDRLICANQTVTSDEYIKLFGYQNLKNAILTGQIEQGHKYDFLLKNHLENKIGAFFVHGDGGADDYSHTKYPKTFQPSEDKNIEPETFITPLLLQCRYSGINIPSDLVHVKYYNTNIPYSEANQKPLNKNYFIDIKNLVERLLIHLKSI